MAVGAHAQARRHRPPCPRPPALAHALRRVRRRRRAEDGRSHGDDGGGEASAGSGECELQARQRSGRCCGRGRGRLRRQRWCRRCIRLRHCVRLRHCSRLWPSGMILARRWCMCLRCSDRQWHRWWWWWRRRWLMRSHRRSVEHHIASLGVHPVSDVGIGLHLCLPARRQRLLLVEGVSRRRKAVHGWVERHWTGRMLRDRLRTWTT